MKKETVKMFESKRKIAFIQYYTNIRGEKNTKAYVNVNLNGSIYISKYAQGILRFAHYVKLFYSPTEGAIKIVPVNLDLKEQKERAELGKACASSSIITVCGDRYSCIPTSLIRFGMKPGRYYYEEKDEAFFKDKKTQPKDDLYDKLSEPAKRIYKEWEEISEYDGNSLAMDKFIRNRLTGEVKRV